MLDPARNELGRIGARHREPGQCPASRGHGPHRRARRRLLHRRRRRRHRRHDATPARRRSPRRAPTSARSPAATTCSRAPAAATRCAARTPARRSRSPAPAPRADPILADGLSIVGRRGRRDRRPVHHSSDARRDRAASASRSPIPSRVAAAAPIRASAATTQHRQRHDQRGRSARRDQRAAADHRQHRVHVGDHVHGQRRPAASPTRPAATSTSTAGACRSTARRPRATRFTVRSNAGATGDNRNAFALADALRAGVLDGGTVSVASAVERLTGRRRPADAHGAGQPRRRSAS